MRQPALLVSTSATTTANPPYAAYKVIAIGAVRRSLITARPIDSTMTHQTKNTSITFNIRTTNKPGSSIGTKAAKVAGFDIDSRT